MFVEQLKMTAEDLGYSVDGMESDELLMTILVNKGIITIEELKEYQDYLISIEKV